MSLDGALKAVQIAFYVTGATVAVLTYRSARKGLLNTVNTEYYKRVIDRLNEINTDLMSELDPHSDAYWYRKRSVEKAAEWIVEFCKASVVLALTPGFDPESTAIPGCYDEDRMIRLLTAYRSDPFIPTALREHLVYFLDGRRRAIHLSNAHATAFALRKVMTLRSNLDWNLLLPDVNNHIIYELEDRGFGLSQVEEKTSEYRMMMQKFFLGFDPTVRRRWLADLDISRRADLSARWVTEQVRIMLGRE